MLQGFERSLKRLKDIARKEGVKGKGKEVDRRTGDDAWETMWNLGEALKRSDRLRAVVGEGEILDDLIHWYVLLVKDL
jgi:hypothetical protein